MSELDRRSQEQTTANSVHSTSAQYTTLGNLGNLLSQASEQASLLQHDSELLRSARPEALSLPIVHASVDATAAGARAGSSSGTKEGISQVVFTPHALHVSSHAATLTSHITQEETSLPLSTVFDIFPVPCTEGSEKLFQSAPTPHLLQILSVVPRPPGGGAAGELTVTLALPSVAECSRLASTLMRCREALLSKEVASVPKGVANPKTTASSTLPSPGTNGVAGTGSRPSSGPSSPLRRSLSEPRSEGNSGLVNFASLCIQAVPLFKAWGPRSGAADSSVQSGYKPCSVQLNSHGLLIELSSTSSAGPGPGPWALPWSSVLEARAVEGSSAEVPPAVRESAQVVRIVVSYRTGLTGNTWCTLNISSELPGQVDSFLRALQVHQPNQFPSVPSERPLRQILSEIPTARPVGATPPGGGPSQSRVSAQVSATGAPPGGATKENEPLHVVHINNVPVPLTATMANLLMDYQPEDSEQPEPLFMSQVWVILLSTCGGFQRSAVCIDKLGLTITPLVAAKSLPEGARLGAQASGTLRGAGGSGGVPPSRGWQEAESSEAQEDVALMTETLNFPISAVVEVSEETEFKPAAEADKSNATQATAAPGSTAGGRGGAGTSSGAGGSSGSSEGTSKRRAVPFQRALGPWGEKASDDPSGSKIKPPHPHLVGVRVKGALAGRLNGPDKTPIQMRLNAQPPPPVAMVLCFAEKDKSLQFLSRMSAFRKYQFSVALSTYLNTLTAVSQRQTERRGHRLVEEGVVAQRMLGQVVAPSLEPPPMPPRPSDLPPPSRLPRMVTNDEGEVFWYIPRKQPQPLRPQKAAAARQPGPVAPPNPDAELGHPPPETPSTQASTQPDQAKLGDFLGGTNSDSIRLQTPRKGALKSALKPAASPVQPPSNAAATSATPAAFPAPMTGGFDDDLPVADTPAPCLVSPTPSPGRRVCDLGN